LVTCSIGAFPIVFNHFIVLYVPDAGAKPKAVPGIFEDFGEIQIVLLLLLFVQNRAG